MTIIIYLVRAGGKRTGGPRCMWGSVKPTGEGEASVTIRPLVF